MKDNKTFTALSVAVAFGVLSFTGGAFAAGKHKPIHASAAASAAHGAATDPATPLDALFVQHKDAGWHSNHESWCDVDPNCNGWNKNMQNYETTK